MKKIFIVMLLFLSFSLTSCNRVKFEKYENEVESVNFRSEFAGEYQEFYKRWDDGRDDRWYKSACFKT